MEKSFLLICWKILTTAASLSGWEAALDTLLMQGTWTSKKSNFMINILELQAIPAMLDTVNGRPILIHMDNAPSVAYINYQGGIRRLTAAMKVERILSLAELHVPALSTGSQTFLANSIQTWGMVPSQVDVPAPVPQVGDTGCRLPGLQIKKQDLQVGFLVRRSSGGSRKGSVGCMPFFPCNCLL